MLCPPVLTEELDNIYSWKAMIKLSFVLNQAECIKEALDFQTNLSSDKEKLCFTQEPELDHEEQTDS